METWKPVPGFSAYEASDDGRVRSKQRSRPHPRNTNMMRTIPGKMLKPFARKGYLVLNVMSDCGKIKRKGVHQLVALAWLGVPEEGQEVNHKDGNKLNNRQNNFEYVTNIENVAHAYRTGLISNKGQTNGRAKLSDDQARAIRSSDKSTEEIMSEHNCSKDQVRNIKKRRRWKHLVSISFLLLMPSMAFGGIKFGTLPKVETQSSAEAVPTPDAQISKILDSLPRPRQKFVDFGCGADARWCIAAAHKWGCPCIGVEIDQTRARMAKERVRQEGLDHLIEIYCADSTEYSYESCDVGVAYLFEDTLQKLKPQIEKLRAFASYIHEPPVASTKIGDAWIYTRPAQARMAIWGGQYYAGPVCNDPNCGMCNSIRAQQAANNQD